MAVSKSDHKIESFEQWYQEYKVDPYDGCLSMGRSGLQPYADRLLSQFGHFEREMNARCADYYKLEMIADNEVISQKQDLPNISSGETSGLVRRIARNLVQHTPNVEVISVHDDTSTAGVLANYVLRSKIIGSDQYSNDMQQNLFASTKTALTVGFDCVIPVLMQNPEGEWHYKYDSIHYRDVFPEPGAKDVRDATEVYVRRYLTRGQIRQLIRSQAAGWDVAALRQLVKFAPTAPPKQRQSNSHFDSKRKVIAEGYEVITWYNSYGDPFLTYSPSTKLLLRIEKNKHPMKWHPVFFLVLEKDAQQPLGKPQVELVLGRQEFQDLMLNGAMKMWYRNINPPLLGFGATNAIPNLSPGKYTPVSNPNARIEPFEVSTQTLISYNSIAQNNLGAMVNNLGSSDQQMAASAGGGMSATPQGVEAQEEMVGITTSNFQKAIESFFSHYCSYALTMYFQELSNVTKLTPSADARRELINSGIPPEEFGGDGTLEANFKAMAVPYHVRCVPGSLVELEDEKQLRILNQLFVPLSQAMPALQNSPEVLNNAASAMQFIILRQIELSGSNRAKQLESLMRTGNVDEAMAQDAAIESQEQVISGTVAEASELQAETVATVAALQEQIRILAETQQLIMQRLGVPMQGSTDGMNPSIENSSSPEGPTDMVTTARA